MRVLCLVQGPPRVASSRTRAFAYVPFLRRAGIACDVVVWNSETFVERSVRGAVSARGHLGNAVHRARALARFVAGARRSDTLFIQKVALPAWLLRLLKHGGRRLVFDYDDALYVLGPGQDTGLRARIRRRRTRRFLEALRETDLVILENEINREVTARYCPNTLLITGPIDTARYTPTARPESDRVVLGWIGSPSTATYLRLIEPALAELVRCGHRIELHVVGATVRMERVPVRCAAWSLEDEVARLGVFDVGLMPLTDDEWARGKGGYKILQYMAMGIPTVASPVGINADLVRHGETGFHADTHGEWVRTLETLITERALCHSMGAAARRDAVARYSLEHHAPAFITALAGGRAPAALRLGRKETEAATL